jgi:uncharacterized membrane protein
MKPWERYSFAALAALITVTGGAYFWMKYLLVTDDPFAVVNHRLQGLMLQVHVLAAPAFLVMFGIIFNSHIGRKIGKKIPNRRSGLLALVTLVAMTASGYLLQVMTGETALWWMMAAHLTSGAVFAGAYVTHLAISVRIWARERRTTRHRAAA